MGHHGGGENRGGENRVGVAVVLGESSPGDPKASRKLWYDYLAIGERKP